MKQSVFSQEWEYKGVHSTVKAKIIVTMNYSTKPITGQNRSTHEDYTTNVYTHKVEGFINEKIWWRQYDIDSESTLLNEAERCKKQLQADIESIADLEPIKTFVEKMQDLGFK